MYNKLYTYLHRDTPRHNENKKALEYRRERERIWLAIFALSASHRSAIFASVRLRERVERIESLARLITYEFAFRQANSVFHIPASDELVAEGNFMSFFRVTFGKKLGLITETA